jgi:hypothetical protein
LKQWAALILFAAVLIATVVMVPRCKPDDHGPTLGGVFKIAGC